MHIPNGYADIYSYPDSYSYNTYTYRYPCAYRNTYINPRDSDTYGYSC